MRGGLRVRDRAKVCSRRVCRRVPWRVVRLLLRCTLVRAWHFPLMTLATLIAGCPVERSVPAEPPFDCRLHPNICDDPDAGDAAESEAGLPGPPNYGCPTVSYHQLSAGEPCAAPPDFWCIDVGELCPCSYETEDRTFRCIDGLWEQVHATLCSPCPTPDAAVD